MTDAYKFPHWMQARPAQLLVLAFSTCVDYVLPTHLANDYKAQLFARHVREEAIAAFSKLTPRH